MEIKILILFSYEVYSKDIYIIQANAFEIRGRYKQGFDAVFIIIN